MINVVKIQLERILTVKLILISLVITLIQFFSVYNEIVHPQPSVCVWYLCSNSVSHGTLFFVTYFIPALVFSYTIAIEIASKADRFWVIRSGVRQYTLSKMLASAAGGFLCIFLGFLILVGICALKYPLFLKHHGTDAYGYMMEEGKVAAGFLMYLIDLSFSGAVTAAVGTAAGIFIPSPFASVAAPIVIFLSISRLADGLRLPVWFNAANWMKPNDITSDLTGASAGKALLLKITVCCIVILIASALGIWKMERRVING